MQQTIRLPHGLIAPGNATRRSPYQTSPSRNVSTDQGAAQETPQPIALSATIAEPDPGYVYLSVSRAMPGFVQVASSRQDPKGLTWTLQTTGGVTHFRNVHTLRTTNCAALIARFHDAAAFNQIPHHSDLFKISLRFARNILDLEAYFFRPAGEPAPRQKHSVKGYVAGIVGTAVLLFALLPHSSSKPGQTAEAQPVVPQSEVSKPAFGLPASSKAMVKEGPKLAVTQLAPKLAVEAKPVPFRPMTTQPVPFRTVASQSASSAPVADQPEALRLVTSQDATAPVAASEPVSAEPVATENEPAASELIGKPRFRFSKM